MTFQSAKSIGEQQLIHVDHEKYIFEEDDYILKKRC